MGSPRGGLVVWLVLRPRIKHEYDRARSESEAERATLAERLQGKIDQTRTLEAEVSELDAKLSAFQNDNAGLLARISSLETQLEGERKAAAEKLTLLEDARGKLSDAFKALSAEALNTNSQNFLSLARETLGHFQEAAKGDLDTRHKAIGELVLPLKESLDKVDTKIRELESVRATAYSSLTEQVRHLATSQVQLQTETSKLVNAHANMQAEMLRAVKRNGGAVFVNFSVAYLDQKAYEVFVAYRDNRDREIAETLTLHGGDSRRWEMKRAIQQRYRSQLPKVDIKAALRHIDHIAKVAGPDHVGIGSDFDGISGMAPAGLEDVSKFPELVRGLIELGYPDEDIRKIMGGNLLRIMRANEAIAEK